MERSGRFSAGQSSIEQDYYKNGGDSTLQTLVSGFFTLVLVVATIAGLVWCYRKYRAAASELAQQDGQSSATKTAAAGHIEMVDEEDPYTDRVNAASNNNSSRQQAVGGLNNKRISAAASSTNDSRLQP